MSTITIIKYYAFFDLVVDFFFAFGFVSCDANEPANRYSKNIVINCRGCVTTSISCFVVRLIEFVTCIRLAVIRIHWMISTKPQIIHKAPHIMMISNATWRIISRMTSAKYKKIHRECVLFLLSFARHKISRCPKSVVQFYFHFLSRLQRW